MRGHVRRWMAATAIAGVASMFIGAPPGGGSRGTLRAHDEGLGPAEAQFLGNIRKVTFEGRRAGEGYFSADGTLMVFQSEREPDNPFYQIYLMDLETGDTHRVSPGRGKTTCAWIHPDRERVLFASTHEDSAARDKEAEERRLRETDRSRRYDWSYDEHFDVYVADLDGKNLRKLTHARGYDAEGSFSPDGRRIAFASNRHAYVDRLSEDDAERFEIDKSFLMDIYIMNADGSEVRRLTTEEGYDGGPFFSPDGERICWRHFNREGNLAEIFTMRIDGTDKKQLTRLEAMSWAPFYHPSGDYLVFTTNVHGFANFELYIVDADGGSQPVRITTTDGFDGLPVFHPDGKLLSWTSTRAGDVKGQIFFGDWNDAEARRALGLGAPDLNETRTAITAEDIRLHVRYLASERLQGRLAGTPGETLAAEHIARSFRRSGLAPAGAAGSYFQSFSFAAGMRLGAGNRLRWNLPEAGGRGSEPGPDRDWRPLSFSRTGEIDEAPVVFGGYGLIAPAEGPHPPYDSFDGLDVKDKWVMVLRYVPEDLPQSWREHLLRHSSLRFKAMVLSEKKALGMIVVSGPRSKVRDPLVKLRLEAASGDIGLAAISVTDGAANRMLAPAKKSVLDLQLALDQGAHIAGFEIPTTRIAATIDLVKEKRTGRNVLARLTAGEAPGETFVVLGAHYDHLGRGEGGNSLARPDEEGMPHYGADDNASGVAGMLEAAQWLASLVKEQELSLVHDIVFAGWSGEELGLLGSQHFVENLEFEQHTGQTRPVVAYLNLDMIGRLRDHLTLQGVGSSSIWLGEIERRNAPVGLALQTSPDCFLPTDTTPFYLRGVPILSAFTGAHADYHTPRDIAAKVNYEGAQAIARLMALIARSLAMSPTLPDYLETAPEQRPGRSAAGRIWLGTIPDYAESETPGLKLQGTIPGGPAERAGIQGGDLIVELAGKKVESIYDFMHAMKDLSVGKPARLVVLRNGDRIPLEIVPASRE